MPAILLALLLMSPASAGVRVAILGDQGADEESLAVLRLVRDEGAELVLHQGDFDYRDDPAGWERRIDSVLGSTFPYLASLGNHDVEAHEGYLALQTARLARTGIACEGEVLTKASCLFRGLQVVVTAPGLGRDDYASFIRASFEGSPAPWRLCSWHLNMRKMQVGGKPDQAGWAPYEACREAGALVLTGHEHSYSRTHLMSSFERQVVASTTSLALEPGRSVAIVSGLGGKSVRPQRRHDPWWAAVWTRDQDAAPGALFCDFGFALPYRAECWFKDIRGRVPDRFILESRPIKG